MKKNGVLSRLLSLLFVPKCLCCKSLLYDPDGVLCGACRVKYDLLCHRKCKSCGRDICNCECTKEGVATYGVWRLSKLCAYVPSEKNDPFKSLLYYFKHGNSKLALEFFSDSMEKMIRSRCQNISEFTLCYVPRSKGSERRYGYDHAQRLAASLSEKLGIPYERVFVRTERSKVQKELDRTQRFINANDTIDLSSKYKRNGEGVSGRRFILVDDVCVTGASLGRCATLLISEGAAEVRCFVIGSRP